MQTANRRGRWAGYFRGQFSWARANVVSSTTTTADDLELFLDPPTEVKVESSILLLKRRKVADPDEIPPPKVYFRLIKESSINVFNSMFRGIWDEERTVYFAVSH